MKSDKISQFLQERISAGDFPSAVYLVAEKGKIVLQNALGFAVVEPERIKANFDTIYDLASLTKVLVTGLLTARLIEDGDISLDDRVSDLIPDFCSDGKRDVTILQLLTHTSRLTAWKPLYLFGLEPGHIPEEIGRTPLDLGPGSVTYSDLNFIILGNVIERCAGKSIDAVARMRIFTPLGLMDTYFNPPLEKLRRIAASEKGNLFERETCIEKYPELGIPSSAFRSYQIWGEVHDGNAWFMGGVAAHAGLFSTAEETFKMAQQFLPKYSALLKPETCELFSKNFTPCANEHRSLAFQLASTQESTAGAKMSPESFGHLGFTGTSLWIDPVNERVFVLFTNRTHHHDQPFVNINSVRRRFHDLAIEYIDQNS